MLRKKEVSPLNYGLGHQYNKFLTSNQDITNKENNHYIEIYLELLNTVIDAALVLVDVGPCGPGGAERRNIASRGLGDAVKLEKHFCKQITCYRIQETKMNEKI